MELTDTVRFQLEKLKNTMILFEGGELGIVLNCQIEDIKYTPFLGRPIVRKTLTKIHVKRIDHIGTNFRHAYDSDALYFLQEARDRFIKMRNELDKFGFAIKSKSK